MFIATSWHTTYADGSVIGPKIKKSKKSLGGSIYDKCAETVRDLLYEMDSVNASKLMVRASFPPSLTFTQHTINTVVGEARIEYTKERALKQVDVAVAAVTDKQQQQHNNGDRMADD